MDEGPILAQAAVPVLPGDTEDSLAARVLVQEHRLYPAALAAFAAGRPGIAARRTRRWPTPCRARRGRIERRQSSSTRAGRCPAVQAKPGDRMSGHHSTTPQFTGPTTPEAYFADRQRMWSSFTGAAIAGAIFVALLLIGMAVFLL